jgi:hypothetical protein
MIIFPNRTFGPPHHSEFNSLVIRFLALRRPASETPYLCFQIEVGGGTTLTVHYISKHWFNLVGGDD